MILLVWGFIAATSVLENGVRLIRRAEPLTAPGLLWQIEDALLHWGLWILLTPVVFWLVRRVPLQMEGRFKGAYSHMGLSVVIAVVQVMLWAPLSLWIASRGHRFLPEADTFLLVLQVNLTENVFIYWALVGVASAFDYLNLSRERELQAVKLRAELTEGRLRALREQLRPHFFFNALSSAAELVRRGEPEHSRQLLIRLADLFRQALELTEVDAVPLAEEVGFLRTYAEIQEDRRDDVRIHFDVDRELAEAMRIPPLILQPLLENAMRHARPHPEEGLDVWVSAEVGPDGRIRMEVADSGTGDTPSTARMGKGTGLKNTRARLRHAYGDAARLWLVAREPRGLAARIELEPGAALRQEPVRESREPVGAVAFD